MGKWGGGGEEARKLAPLIALVGGWAVHCCFQETISSQGTEAESLPVKGHPFTHTLPPVGLKARCPQNHEDAVFWFWFFEKKEPLLGYSLASSALSARSAVAVGRRGSIWLKVKWERHLTW